MCEATDGLEVATVLASGVGCCVRQDADRASTASPTDMTKHTRWDFVLCTIHNEKTHVETTHTVFLEFFWCALQFLNASFFQCAVGGDANSRKFFFLRFKPERENERPRHVRASFRVAPVAKEVRQKKNGSRTQASKRSRDVCDEMSY